MAANGASLSSYLSRSRAKTIVACAPPAISPLHRLPLALDPPPAHCARDLSWFFVLLLALLFLTG